MFLIALSLASSVHPHDATCDCAGPAGPAVRPPVLRSGTITDDDYPASALRDQAEGQVRLRLAVGADGRVTGCTIDMSSGHAALDSTSCSLAQRRLRFVPAQDAAGRNVAGEATRSVSWRRPAPAPVLPAK